MMSVVVKNFVLMLLLLSIVHIMIKNHFDDTNQKYMTTSPLVENKCREDDDESSKNDVTNNDSDVQGKPYEGVCDDNGGDHAAHVKELYDFVYSDDTAESGLDFIFDTVSRSQAPSKEQAAILDDDCIDKHIRSKTLEPLPATNSCDNDGLGSGNGGGSASCEGSKNITEGGNPILFEYNEPQVGLLGGYESFGSSFATL